MDDMDDLCDQIRELCAGKTVEEIEEAIGQSAISGRVQDPAGLARYFFEVSADQEVPPEDEVDEPVPDEDDG